MNYRKIEQFSTPFHREGILALLRHYHEMPGTMLLFSGQHQDAAKQSFAGLFPTEIIQIHHDIFTHQIGQSIKTQPIGSANPWEFAEAYLSAVSDEEIPDWIGFLSYEMGATSDLHVTLKRLYGDTPDLYFQRSALLVKVNHENETVEVYVRDESEQVTRCLEHIHKIFSSEQARHLTVTEPLVSFIKSSDTESTFINKVQRIQEHILEGDVYQLNLSQEMEFAGDVQAFDLFCRLFENNPAPFSAYLKLETCAIVSSSPERFLQKTGAQLETRPIKGTAPRGKTTLEDSENKCRLLGSSKERAELAMITDLMRNDIGQVSRIGSVKVKELFRCEAYTNVFHLLSIIHGEVRSELTSWNIIRACFPGGSITGCPKLRAIELIHEIEQRPRGIYTGSIGYICGNGDFDFNIAIRTVIVTKKKIVAALGSGIVADSDPQKEYVETLHKGKTIFQGLLCDGFI